MRWRIVNQTPQLLIVTLNSGKAVHLAPHETSPPIEHAEINGNVKVDRLHATGSIAVAQEKTQEVLPVVRVEARRAAPKPVVTKSKSKQKQAPVSQRESKREHKK